MQTMFIIYSLLCLVGYLGFITSLWAMMQDGGLFDHISNGAWTIKMNSLYEKKSLWEKILGGCMRCGSFWLYWLYFPLYVALLSQYWSMNWYQSIAWVLVYWFICSFAGYSLLVYQNKK